MDPDKRSAYVSRGGVKLAGALAQSGIDPTGWVVLDVGQSTGGFTDCLLQAGASQVVGVDVGHEQLAAKLRDHPQVVCYEGINARLRSEEHTSELQSRGQLVCRLLLDE